MGTSFDYLLNALPNPKPKPPIERIIGEARRQLNMEGITDEQRQKGYKGLISEAFYQNLNPRGYDGHGLEVLRSLHQALTSQVIPDTIPDRMKSVVVPMGQKNIVYTPNWPDKNRDDAWRLYLGLPQKHGTFDISNFQPAVSKDQKPYFKIKDFWNFFDDNEGNFANLVKQTEVAKGKLPTEDSTNDIMGNYAFRLGKDEKGSYISYYDLWDLAKTGSTLAGHPYEIYDRQYYDPKTYKRIPEDKLNGH